jgi:hypothetical protein
VRIPSGATRFPVHVNLRERRTRLGLVMWRGRSHALPLRASLLERYGNVSFVDVNKAPSDYKGLDGSISIMVVEPYRLKLGRLPREYRIYLTLFESDRIPASWVTKLNDHASEVTSGPTTCPLRHKPVSCGYHAHVLAMQLVFIDVSCLGNLRVHPSTLIVF